MATERIYPHGVGGPGGRDVPTTNPALAGPGATAQNMGGTAGVTWEAADPVILNYGVNLEPIKREVRDVIAKYSRTSPTGALESIPAELTSILEKPGVVPYAQAQRIRTSLFNYTKQFERGATEVSPTMSAQAERLSGVLSREMDNAASKAPREVRDILTRANRMWANEMTGNYSEQFVVKVLEDSPVVALNTLLQSRDPRAVHLVRSMVERAAGPIRARIAGAAEMGVGALAEGANTSYATTWEKMQGSFINKLIEQASEGVTMPGGGLAQAGKVNWDNLYGLIDEVTKSSGGALWKAWGVEPQINRLREIANFARFATKAPGGSGSGSVFFQLGQASVLSGAMTAGINLAGGQDLGSAAVTGGAVTGSMFILTPLGVNRMLTDPATNKWLTVGIAAKPHSRLWAKAGFLLLGKALQNGWLEAGQEDAARKQMDVLSSQHDLVPGDIRLTPEERAALEQARTTTMDQIRQNTILEKRPR